MQSGIPVKIFQKKKKNHSLEIRTVDANISIGDVYAAATCLVLRCFF